MPLVELVRMPNGAGAELLRGRIESAGVHAVCFDAGMNIAESVGLMIPVRIMVLDEDLDEARALLAEFDDPGNGLAAGALGSGPINSTFEASKWRRYRALADAAGSIAPRKAAKVRDRSHFGVPAGFDRFCPGQRRKVWKYNHIPAPFLLALSKIASNLERGINGS